MTRAQFSAIFAASILTAGVFAQAGQVDYSKLPAPPSEALATLNKCSLSLAEAITKAEEETGGRAHSAWYDGAGDKLSYHIVLVTNKAMHIVEIDGATGMVVTDVSEAGGVIPGWAIPEGVAIVTTDSGLRYYDIHVGEGAQPAGPTARVTVHYTGYLVDGKKFDSSVDRGQPLTFGLDRVIPGWTEGVGSMKVGGKRKLLIPYQLAYGERGRPGAIPPKAMLIFDVELLELP